MGRKPPIEPGKRREWFRRYEEDGQSIAFIAKDTGYDIRTIRKQIDIERQERERKETRHTVLRNALEKHYGDLCGFAKKINGRLGGERDSLADLKEDRLWLALQEHLPRSPLWKNIDTWEALRKERARLRAELQKLLQEWIGSHLESVSSSSSVGLDKRLFAAINPYVQEAASGHPERLSEFNREKVPENEDPRVAQLITDLLETVATLQPYKDLMRVSVGLNKYYHDLSDELAIIIYRRVVPGRCRYCPV